MNDGGVAPLERTGSAWRGVRGTAAMIRTARVAVVGVLLTACFQLGPEPGPGSEPPPTVSVTGGGRVVEGSPQGGTFTIARDGSTARSLIVSYRLEGTARAPQDFSALSGSITLPAGSSSVSVRIFPRQDGVAEPDESVSLVLLSGSGYVLGAATTSVLVIQDATQSPQALKVMPLGDSLTHGKDASDPGGPWVPGAYRIRLWDLLVQGGIKVDFVGSLANGPAELGDRDHEGHPGFTIDEIRLGVSGWLSASSPDLVLLLIGTNDIINNSNDSAATAPQRLSALLDTILASASAPGRGVLVATIPPLSDPARDTMARSYNSSVRQLVEVERRWGDRVRLVDLYPAVSKSDLVDGIHPNRAGYDKMAAVWFDAIQRLLGRVP